MVDMRLSDLSRPSSRLLTIGEINVAATTTAAAARDLIILFFVNILLLLGPPNATAASAAPLTGCLHLGSGPHRPCFAGGSPSQTHTSAFGGPLSQHHKSTSPRL